MKEGQGKLTAGAIVALALIIGGIVLAIFASSVVVKVVGVIIALGALLAVLSAGQPASSRLGAWARPQMKQNISTMMPAQGEPEPEYIAEAPEASKDVWEHERELYHEKEEREQHEHEEREQQGHGEPQA